MVKCPTVAQNSIHDLVIEQHVPPDLFAKPTGPLQDVSPHDLTESTREHLFAEQPGSQRIGESAPGPDQTVRSVIEGKGQQRHDVIVRTGKEALRQFQVVLGIEGVGVTENDDLSLRRPAALLERKELSQTTLGKEIDPEGSGTCESAA